MRALQAVTAFAKQQVQKRLFAGGFSMLDATSVGAKFSTKANSADLMMTTTGLRGPGLWISINNQFMNRCQSLTGRLFETAFPKSIGLTNVWSPVPSRSYTLYEMHVRGIPPKKRPKTKPLDGNPFMKGVVLKTLIKNPKKPNSGNRKCVLVRLSNGAEKVAHVPGVGHTLQEHNMVLVRCGRLKDTPGVQLKVVRGKYDCGHVVRKPQRVNS